MLGLMLRIRLQLLLEGRIYKAGFARNGRSSLNRWPCVDLLPPFVEVRERFKVNSSEHQNIHPAEACYVCNAILVADEILVVLEPNVQDSAKTFGLADIALDAVRYPLLGETIEVVGLLCGVSMYLDFRIKNAAPVLASRKRAQSARVNQSSWMFLTGPSPPVCQATHCSHSDSSGSDVKLNL